MGVDNFSGENNSTSGGPTRNTYYQFENPDHPDSKDFDDPEEAKRQFKAARYIQDRLGTDRHNLVGKFLIAVQAYEEDGDEEELQELVDQLTS